MPQKLIATLAAATLLLSGCSKDLSSDTYTSNSTSGKVLQGTIISARTVKVKEHDKLQDNTAGGLAGGALGAVGGASVGHGNGSLAAGIGGAIVGAVTGALVEDALGTSEGEEYLVKLDPQFTRDAATKTKKIVKGTDQSIVSDDMKSSISANTQTDVISVVQKADASLAVGSRVYVVYSDDRPRLAPMNPPPPPVTH